MTRPQRERIEAAIVECFGTNQLIDQLDNYSAAIGDASDDPTRLDIAIGEAASTLTDAVMAVLGDNP